MDEQDLTYALAKQVPDMQQRGFIIGTAYGELSIAPGALADRIAERVRVLLEQELAWLRRGA